MTVVAADWLIAEPGEDPIANGAVRVLGQDIVAVGTRPTLVAEYSSDDLIDFSGCVLAPGFVNAHVHMYGVLAHGIPVVNVPSDFWSFLDDFWWPYVEDRLDLSMILAATEYVAGELLRSGTTTFLDILEAPNALPGVLLAQREVVQRTGLRGILSFEATERVSVDNGRRGLDENAAMIAAGRIDGPAALVTGLMSIHTTFTCPPAFIATAFGLAEDLDVLLHAHVNEGMHEGERCLERYGQRTLELYDSLGVAGPRFQASQCVQLSDRERAIIAERGVKLTHMPLSNCEVGGGIAPIPELLEAGAPLGLGSDGYLNDMFQVMRGAFLIHKARLCDPQVMPAHTVFRMATLGGADALGLAGRIGRLAPGYAADLQLIDISSLPTPLGVHNLYDQLVLWRTGKHVQSVMVNGSWRVRDGAVTDVDTERARVRVAEEARRLWTLP